MPWITPSLDALAGKMSGPEREACSSAALDDGQVNPLPEALADAIALARLHVGTCPKNKLGPEGTVPAGLLSTVQDIAAYNALSRLPVQALLTDSRTKLFTAAIRRLEEVAACKLAIDQPESTGPEVMPTGSGTALANRTNLQFTRAATGRL